MKWFARIIEAGFMDHRQTRPCELSKSFLLSLLSLQSGNALRSAREPSSPHKKEGVRSAVVWAALRTIGGVP